ncbi:hypothetical protein F383_32181 [Gossypium arboreum]|uniref:Uncharacterized protein n=1 Tax=Gossypium arboreum TaxID=29729 RepID=A0A0B0MVQ6_GOSAR|nr:hypothetical protein F383_32181 [Gossypium arboreum]
MARLWLRCVICDYVQVHGFAMAILIYIQTEVRIYIKDYTIQI